MCPGSYISLPPYIKHDIRAFMAVFIFTFYGSWKRWVGFRSHVSGAAGAVELNLVWHCLSVTFYLLYFLL